MNSDGGQASGSNNDSLIHINETSISPLNNIPDTEINKITNNKTMFLSSRIENFKIEVGTKVIEACPILRNVTKFTADSDPIEVDMSREQLEKFVKLHNYFDENDPWDKIYPNFVKKFFSKMSKEEFKQFCWKADFLDSQRFLNNAAAYLLLKLQVMKVEEIQEYLNIVNDYSENERKEIQKEPFKYFLDIALLDEKKNVELQNFISQSFSFPESLTNFAFNVSKIPINLFLKLYSTCKYFFARLKLLPCSHITAGVRGIMEKDEVGICYGEEVIRRTNIKDIQANFYVLNQFSFYTMETNLLKNIVRHDVTLATIWMPDLILTVKEFNFLFSPSVVDVSLCLKVVDPNEKIMPVEEILGLLPNIYKFTYEGASPECYTLNTTQKMAALKRTVKFRHFSLKYPHPDIFNAEGFAKFIKNHAHPTYKGNFYVYFEGGDDNEIISYIFSIVVKVINSWEPASLKPRFLIKKVGGISFDSDKFGIQAPQ